MKLTPKQKLASIKAGAIQLWAPYALEMAIRGEEPPLTPGQWKVLDERHNLLRLSTTAGSWNHQQMLWALALWIEEGQDRWWESYLKYQLGDFDKDLADLKHAGYLTYWGGSESNSAGYEHMRWGCVCAVDLWARRHKDREQRNALLALCGRYYRTQVAMCRLLPTPVGERSGEHSKPLHLEMWKLAEGRQPKKKWPREIDWPMRLLQKVTPIPLPVGRVEDLARPLFSEIRVAIWPGVDGATVYWLVERKNFNTPCYLIEVDYGDGWRDQVYPWRKGRAFNDKRPGSVRLVSADGQHQLQWQIGTREELEMGEVDPPLGPPSRCYAIGQQGYVEGDWAAWLRGE